MNQFKRNLVLWMLIALVAALSLHAYNARADQASCKAISTLAERTMEARQLGVPMSKMMETDLELARLMVIQAYETPRYSTERVQQREIADFRDEWYLACVKAES